MTIAFIGAGNMAISLIRGLLETGTAPTTIIAADPSQEQRTKAANLGIKTSEDNNTAIRQAEVVVIAVKPQIAADVVKSLDSITRSNLSFLSRRALILKACSLGFQTTNPSCAVCPTPQPSSALV